MAGACSLWSFVSFWLLQTDLLAWRPRVVRVPFCLLLFSFQSVSFPCLLVFRGGNVLSPLRPLSPTLFADHSVGANPLPTSFCEGYGDIGGWRCLFWYGGRRSWGLGFRERGLRRNSGDSGRRSARVSFSLTPFLGRRQDVGYTTLFPHFLHVGKPFPSR